MSANAPLIVVAVGVALALIDRLSVIVLCRMALRAGVDFEGEVKTFGHRLHLKVMAGETELRRGHSTSRNGAMADSRKGADLCDVPVGRGNVPGGTEGSCQSA